MAHSYPAVNTAADTFGVFVTKVNSIINAVASEVITANNAANGAVTTGNAYLNGILYATTLTTSKLRGGNVQSTGPLLIDSNVTINTASLSIGNSTINTFANSTYIDVTLLDVTSANIVTANISIGTANTLSILTSLAVGNASITSAGFTVANTLATSVLAPTNLNIGNSTVNVTVTSSIIQFSNTSGTFSIDAQGSVSATEYASRFKFANTLTTGTSLQTIDSFPKTDYRAAEYLITVMDLTANNRQSTKVNVLHDDSTTLAYSTEYATVISNNSLGLFSAAANSTHVLLQFTPTSANTKVSYGRIGVNAQ